MFKTDICLIAFVIIPVNFEYFGFIWVHTTSVQMLVCSVIGISVLYDIGAPPPSINSDDDVDDDDDDDDDYDDDDENDILCWKDFKLWKLISEKKEIYIIINNQICFVKKIFRFDQGDTVKIDQIKDQWDFWR